MNKLEWVTLDDQPMHLVTPDGVMKWQSEQVRFTVSYDLMERTKRGRPLYRCRYQPQDSTDSYLLVEPRSGEEIDVRSLSGWKAVVEHHTQYGDGRDIHLNSDSTIRLV